MDRWRAGVFVALAAALLTGCGRKPTATAPAPTPDVTALGAPELSVVTEPVSFRRTELESPTLLSPATVMTITPGANILVGEGGRARLAWGDILQAELLSGTDMLLSQNDPLSRQVILDQATGTSQYELRGVSPAVQVAIQLAWAKLELDSAGARVAVSYVPGNEPSVWVVMLSGSGQLGREGQKSVPLGDGQAIGFTETAGPDEPLGVDPTAVEAWLDRLAAGDESASVAAVALRCRAIGAISLLSAPSEDAPATGEELPAGSIVQVLGRGSDGDWLRVLPLAAVDAGWLQSATLVCNGPLSAAPTASVPPTATVAPTRAVATRPPVPIPVRLTATNTATAVSAVKIYFATTDDSIRLGTCSRLVWEVQGIREVYLDGQGVTGKGEREVCPDETRTYTLKVVHVDGRVEERSVEIEVRKPPTETAAPATETPLPPTTAPTVAASATPTQP